MSDRCGVAACRTGSTYCLCVSGRIGRGVGVCSRSHLRVGVDRRRDAGNPHHAPGSFRRVKSVVVLGGVALIAVLAGVAVAGLPEPVTDEVIVSPPDSSTSTTVASVTVGPTTSAAEPTTTASASTTSAPTSTERLTTSSKPPNATEPRNVSTTVPATATFPSVTPSTGDFAEVRVTVANAAPVDGLAQLVVAEVRGLGFSDPVPATAARRSALSMIYYASGFEAAATRLGGGLGIDAVEPRPFAAITTDDIDADVWVVLGADRLAN